MTEDPKVAVARRLLLASNRGDVEEYLDCLQGDVEWHSIGLFLHPAQIWRGHTDLRRGFERRVDEHGGHPQVTLREIVVRDELVLVVGVIAVPRSRRPVTLPVAWVFRLGPGGKVACARTFATEEQARLEWAGTAAPP